MIDHASVTEAIRRLRDLPGRLNRVQDFAEATASLQAGHGAALDGVWGSSCALAAAALLQNAPGPLVVVCPHAGDIDNLLDDFSLFSAEVPELFPPLLADDGDRVLVDPAYGERLRLLKHLSTPTPPKIVITSIQALLTPVPEKEQVARMTRTLRKGETLDVAEFLRWLTEQGFQSTGAVELPGEFASRGGLIDVFAPDWREPIRIELFGDEIESLRRFTVAEQRSLSSLEEIDITILPAKLKTMGHLADYLPPSSWFFLIEPWELEQEGRHYLSRLENAALYHGMGETLKRLYQFPSVTSQAVAGTSLETTCRLKVESVERFSGDITKVREELDSVSQGQEIFLVCPTEAELTRLVEVLGKTRLMTEGRLHFVVGQLHAGFRLVTEKTALIGSAELFRRSEVVRRSQRRLGRVIDSFLELREGDYVVHLSHGIARYRGMSLLEKEGQIEEHLELEFSGGTKVYVPSSKIDLVQKYVGGAKSRPALAKLGGKTWVRQKMAAEQSVTDMAADMLQLQATRAARPGIAFPPETEWQREFDSAFAYTETPDQLSAIAAVKEDMCAPRPMDRLICGDVGYGKTEVAMRAAFKAIDSGYQVAVLVPTTLLAEQHRRTFMGRMAAFPFSIASLSRFSTRKEQEQIIEKLADGSIDVVIGTHRLVQHDVTFHNLGLIIIDEEQRFGVEVKERLKALKQVVDVLTLTATPIPRTLHMSLLGLRDISNLETPPEDRLAVETRVARFDPDLIRHAVLRELNRDGQIFFVHNRIHDIQVLAEKLNAIVPEARIRIGHGQMPEHELEDVMLDFVEHRFDMLLATTIIESGLDIPNANTIFIDQADQYGLADLHQLRGRVGRFKHRAYCYMLIDPHKHLTQSASKRLHAIEEFSDMGAGFALSMRDLEIRGAGNILGTEQSGHISTVGYELYCQLLEQSVRRLKKLPPKEFADVNLALPGEAFLPRQYVPDQRAKIDLYRRLNRVGNEAELADIAAELQDRFGPPPQTVRRLLERSKLRLWAHYWGIHEIHLEPGFMVLGYAHAQKMRQLGVKSGNKLRIADDRSAYLPIGKDVASAESVMERLKTLLRP